MRENHVHPKTTSISPSAIRIHTPPASMPLTHAVPSHWLVCDSPRPLRSATWRTALQWRHNERDGVSNRQRDCLLNRLFRRISKKTPKLCVTGFCEGNPPMTDRCPSQRPSNAEYVSIWWRHHGMQRDGTQSTHWSPGIIHRLSNLLVFVCLIRYCGFWFLVMAWFKNGEISIYTSCILDCIELRYTLIYTIWVYREPILSRMLYYDMHETKSSNQHIHATFT